MPRNNGNKQKKKKGVKKINVSGKDFQDDFDKSFNDFIDNRTYAKNYNKVKNDYKFRRPQGR